MNRPLHSKILGQGPPLLILHGFLGTSDNWRTLGMQYADHGLEVHLIDQRNHGKSLHSEDFDYDILAYDVKNYVQEHDLEKVTILGHSMGGKTAMQFAMNHQELLHKLIVADIAPKYYPPHHQHIFDALNQLDLDQITTRNQADQELARYVPDPAIRKFLVKGLHWVERGKLGFRFNLEVLSDKMEEIGDTINARDVFLGPTLFLKGDRSSYITTTDSDIIKWHFPNAEIETIDNAGHWVHADNPVQFFNKTMDFIRSQ